MGPKNMNKKRKRFCSCCERFFRLSRQGIDTHLLIFAQAGLSSIAAVVKSSTQRPVRKQGIFNNSKLCQTWSISSCSISTSFLRRVWVGKRARPGVVWRRCDWDVNKNLYNTRVSSALLSRRVIFERKKELSRRNTIEKRVSGRPWELRDFELRYR